MPSRIVIGVCPILSVLLLRGGKGTNNLLNDKGFLENSVICGIKFRGLWVNTNIYYAILSSGAKAQTIPETCIIQISGNVTFLRIMYYRILGESYLLGQEHKPMANPHLPSRRCRTDGAASAEAKFTWIMPSRDGRRRSQCAQLFSLNSSADSVISCAPFLYSLTPCPSPRIISGSFLPPKSSRTKPPTRSSSVVPINNRCNVMLLYSFMISVTSPVWKFTSQLPLGWLSQPYCFDIVSHQAWNFVPVSPTSFMSFSYNCELSAFIIFANSANAFLRSKRI